MNNPSLHSEPHRLSQLPSLGVRRTVVNYVSIYAFQHVVYIDGFSSVHPISSGLGTKQPPPCRLQVCRVPFTC